MGSDRSLDKLISGLERIDQIRLVIDTAKNFVSEHMAGNQPEVPAAFGNWLFAVHTLGGTMEFLVITYGVSNPEATIAITSIEEICGLDFHPAAPHNSVVFALE